MTDTKALAPRAEVSPALAHVDDEYLRQLYMMYRKPDLPQEHPGQPTKGELAIFAQYCVAQGADPFAKDIVFCKDKKGGKIHYQITIDGLRGRSETTGEYLGRLGPYWCDKNGKWFDFWIWDYPPVAARVGILRKGQDQPVWGFARFGSYCSETPPAWSNWAKMPEVMIAKCAEGQAHRAAFPKKNSKLYLQEEMAEIIDAEITEENSAPAKPPVKKFGSPVITPELAEKFSVQEAQAPTVEAEELPAAEVQPTETTEAFTEGEYQIEDLSSQEPPKGHATTKSTAKTAQPDSPSASAAGSAVNSAAPVDNGDGNEADEHFETIRKATGLFGGRILEAVREQVEEPEPAPFNLDPENDNEAAPDAYVQEAWVAWQKVYGRGTESRDKLISIGVKTLQGQPPNKYPRLMLEHLNSLTQEANF